DLHVAELRVAERLPLAEPAAAVLAVVPDDRVRVVPQAVAVVILHRTAVPDLVAVPDRAVVEVAEVRPVAEQRARPRAVPGHGVHGHARGVRLVDVARPRVARVTEADAVEPLVPAQVLRVHAVAALR